jgi:hypothetical protein
LRRHYPATHKVVIYYASTFPAYPPVIRRVALERLPRTVIRPMAMLYVPALPQRERDPKILRWLA